MRAAQQIRLTPSFSPYLTIDPTMLTFPLPCNIVVTWRQSWYVLTTACSLHCTNRRTCAYHKLVHPDIASLQPGVWHGSGSPWRNDATRLPQWPRRREGYGYGSMHSCLWINKSMDAWTDAWTGSAHQLQNAAHPTHLRVRNLCPFAYRSFDPQVQECC